ncbi:MAG: GNAT family N-acetyltransferase [Salibacteraceae bacterium]
MPDLSELTQTITVRPIAYPQTYDLRHRVLRAHQPKEAAEYLEDHEVDSLHLGAFQECRLVGVISMYQKDQPDLDGGYHYRIRGMAVEPELQSKGIGTRMLQRGMQWLQEREVPLVWCNVRLSATAFYQKYGFTVLGPEFDLPPLGPHKVMVCSFTD